MNRQSWLSLWLAAGLIGSAVARVDEFAAEDAVWLTAPGNDVAAAARKRACPPAVPGDKAPVDIGARLELFIDDYLIDGLSGGAERRLHHPVPREVTMEFGARAMPWDVLIGYPTIVRDGDRFLLYYRGMFVNDQYRQKHGGGTGSVEESIQMFIKDSRARDQVVCVLESQDGINFIRPELGLFDLSDRLAGVTTNNNVVWAEGHPTHNFTPFLDANPAASPDARFKAIARRPPGVKGGILCGFKSPDGLRWEVMDRNGGFARHPTDSQNLGFWDAARGYYVCYMRAWGGYPDKRQDNVRCIRLATSPDFINWSETEDLQYNDDRLEHLYTNAIHPYERAPHILIGLPNRLSVRKSVVISGRIALIVRPPTWCRLRPPSFRSIGASLIGCRPCACGAALCGWTDSCPCAPAGRRGK
ncbi:MAG: hypothetical protein LC725_07695 [Lentisphaerae bacterium]|nr:hypothetical protein [Lentisphaerota bacterium]